MPDTKSAPINELSIALQFGARLALTPLKALEFRNKISTEYPGLELKRPIGNLGGNTGMALEMVAEDVDARYWFSSADGYLLVQIQQDLVAFNWRKRNAPGEIPVQQYPGFEEMLRRFMAMVGLFLATLEVSEAPPVSTVNLFYDNLWAATSGKDTIAGFFGFWNTMGIALNGGPDIRFSVAAADESLGAAARIDVNAYFGPAMVLDKPQLVGKLALSAVGHPASYKEVPASLEKMHSMVHSLFGKIVVEERRKELK